MNLKKVCQQVVQKCRNVKIDRKEAEIAKYVNINEVRQSEVYKTLYDAREVLANYAKANNVNIVFKSIPATAERPIADRMIKVVVKGERKLDVNLLDIEKDVIVSMRKNPSRLINKEGNDYMYNGTIACEDNLLRRVYRLVANMTEKTR